MKSIAVKNVPPKDEVVHLKVPTKVYKALKQIAEREHRTIHNMVYVFVIEGIGKRQ